MTASAYNETPIMPGELEMLHGLLRSICRDKSIDVQSQEGTAAAKELIMHFQSGVHDGSALRSAMNTA